MLFVVKLLVTLGFIAFVVHKTGLLTEAGWANLSTMLQQANLWYFAASVCVGVLLNIVSTIKWKVLLDTKQRHVGFGSLLSYYYIGKFFNLILPTSVGGDVVRIYQLGKHTGARAEAAASVFVERFTGMITLTLFSLLAVLLAIGQYNIPLITYSLLFFVVAGATIGWLAIDPRPLNWLMKHLSTRSAFLTRMVDKLSRGQQAIRDYRQHGAAIQFAMLWSVIFYLLAVVNVWVSARAFSPEVDFFSVSLAVPAIMLIMNLPISIGGLGLMEAAYTVVFDLFGYAAALALLTALLMRLKTLVDGGIGGILYLLQKHRSD